MGTNLLRFSFWQKQGKQLISGVITGEDNPPAQVLAKREHFHAIYFHAKNKARVFEQFCKSFAVRPDEVLFFFDDVLDLEVARQCGARIMISRRAAPLLAEFAKSHGMVDYLTGVGGGDHGLREGCELVMGLLGQFEAAVRERMTFSSDYQRYLEERQQIETRVESGAQPAA